MLAKKYFFVYIFQSTHPAWGETLREATPKCRLIKGIKMENIQSRKQKTSREVWVFEPWIC